MTNVEAIEKLIGSVRRSMLDMDEIVQGIRLPPHPPGGIPMRHCVEGHWWRGQDSEDCPICALITISEHSACCDARKNAKRALTGTWGT